MKLLVILPSTQRGGTEKYALTIATAAVEAGWDVHTAFPQTDGTVPLIQEFKIKGVHYHCLEIAKEYVQKARLIRKYLLPFAKTLFLLLKLKPNVVQINLPWIDHCFSCIVACGILKIPTIVVFHLTPFPLSLAGIKLKIYAWARARNQQWVTVSENNRKTICKSFHVPYNEIICIYNGIRLAPNTINIELDKITALRCQIRHELGVLKTSKLALSVSRLHSQKGYSDIIPIISYIVKDFPDLKFIWVGDGEQQEYLVNKVREYSVEDKVIFLGYRSDVLKLMQSADIFIFPTHYEGHPFVLLEAMAYNLPIVTSDASAIPEIIEHKVHGLLFRTGDSYDLLKTLQWALKHPVHMQKMAQNAQLRIQDFSEEKMLKDTLGIMQKLSKTTKSKVYS